MENVLKYIASIYFTANNLSCGDFVWYHVTFWIGFHLYRAITSFIQHVVGILKIRGQKLHVQVNNKFVSEFARNSLSRFFFQRGQGLFHRLYFLAFASSGE
jgi:uncharacterized membrane protein